MKAENAIITAVSKVFAGAHTAAYRVTRGRFGNRFRGNDILLLTVRGRKSGDPHTTPVLYLRDGADYLIAASNGGFDWEPQWWRNLRVNPDAEIEVGGQRIAVRAEQLHGDERAQVWARLVAALSAFTGYQDKVHREIAIVRLHPTEIGSR